MSETLADAPWAKNLIFLITVWGAGFALLAWLGVHYGYRALGLLTPWASGTTFSPAKQQELASNYYPNQLEIWTANHKLLGISNGQPQDSLDYFIQQVLNGKLGPDDRRLYLVVAPTGVGKSAFLYNLYRRYRAFFRNKTPLFLTTAYDLTSPHPTSALAARLASPKAEQTILLVDALDEVPLSAIAPDYPPTGPKPDIDTYTTLFMAFWQKLQTDKLWRFKKVIVAVRQQFLHQASMESLSHSNGDQRHKGHVVRLLPFDTAACKHYLAQQGQARTYEGLMLNTKLMELFLHLEKEQLDFIRVPLVLSQLPYIHAVFRKAQPTGQAKTDEPPSRHQYRKSAVVDTIVERWFAREQKAKELSDAEVLELRRFCQALAYEINSETNRVRLSADALTNFETKQQLGDILNGLGERSLLRRETEMVAGHPCYYFKFIHDVFLEYFLAEYADDPAREDSVQFAGREFTIQLFMSRRWQRQQHQLPVYPRYAALLTEPNPVPANELRQWFTFFNNLTTNQEAQQLFQQQWIRVLNEEHPNWQQHVAFVGVQKLAVIPESLADAETRQALGYLRNFIESVNLKGMPLATNVSYLSCLDKAPNVKLLQLSRTGLTGSDLQVFVASAGQLQELYLEGVDLSEGKQVAWLPLALNLKWLDLNDTRLPGEQVRQLQPLAPGLLEIGLRGIDLHQQDVTWLSQATNLRGLVLDDTQLPGEQAAQLQPIALKLQVLGLQGIKLLHQNMTWLNQALNLQSLNLANTQMLGEQVAQLQSLTLNLQQLGLQGIDLSQQDMTWLSQASNLQSLNLDDTRLPGEQVAQLQPLALNLQEIYLRGIDLSQQDMTWLSQAVKMKRLSLYDTQLPGEQVAQLCALAPNLQEIFLQGIDLSQQDMTWLSQASNLQSINLNDTQLPDEQVQCLAPAVLKLHAFGLRGINLAQGMRWFAQTNNIWYLNLSNTNLPTSILSCFKSSLSTLSILLLAGLDLQEHYAEAIGWLTQTTNLERLDLSETNFPVHWLPSFASSAPALRRLGLGGLQIGEEMAWLVNTANLTHLNLRGTDLSPKELAWFTASAHSLIYLNVADNPRLSEAAFACFPQEYRARLVLLAAECCTRPAHL